MLDRTFNVPKAIIRHFNQGYSNLGIMRLGLNRSITDLNLETVNEDR